MQKAEAAIIEADKPVTCFEIAARGNMTLPQANMAVYRLMHTKTIYRGKDVPAKGKPKPIRTYLHPANDPILTPMEFAAKRLGMPVETYEGFIERGDVGLINEPDMKSLCQVFYTGVTATPQYLGEG